MVRMSLMLREWLLKEENFVIHVGPETGDKIFDPLQHMLERDVAECIAAKAWEQSFNSEVIQAFEFFQNRVGGGFGALQA